MSEPMKVHLPVVRITTPQPTTERPVVPAVLGLVEVDGRHWPVTRYVIEGNVDGYQMVTITFHADLTVMHPADADPLS